MKIRVWLMLAAVLPLWTVLADSSVSTQTAALSQDVCVDHLPGIDYTFHPIDEPRPIRVHVLIIDLSEGRIVPVAVPAEKSPQEDRDAVRTDPRRLARHPNLMAFVNTNPWTPWAPSYPTHVKILGLAATGGVVYSSHHGVSVWADAQGRMYIGDPDDEADIQEGVGGFQQILKETEVIIPEGGAIHPRTAIGVNASGDRLYWVVADGRQPGYSEGMALAELADFMKELGCWDAANMDGGGSSAMGIVDEDGEIVILNDPPAPPGYLRPLPIILTIREKPVEALEHDSPEASPQTPNTSD